MENLSRQADKKAAGTADRLKEGVEAARRRTLDVIDDATVSSEEAIDTARQKGEAYWETAVEQGADLWEDISERTRRTWKEAFAYVQKRPLQVVGIAILAGVVVGALATMGRRKS